MQIPENVLILFMNSSNKIGNDYKLFIFLLIRKIHMKIMFDYDTDSINQSANPW